jgi:hypothetical protein
MSRILCLPEEVAKQAISSLVVMRRGLIALAVVAGCGGQARIAQPNVCRPALPVAAAPSTPLLPRVVLVTIDGVRWQDVFAEHAASELPNLYRLIGRGVALGGPGAPIRATGPNFVSLPGYREILTGRNAGDCLDNDCDPIAEPTLLDELRAAGPLDTLDVAAISSWEVIERAASFQPRTIALSSGRHGGASRDRLRVDLDTAQLLERGAQHNAWPGTGDYRPDELTAELALAYLDARRPRVLYVGLGDTDEFGHHGDRAGYAEALRAADRFLGRLMARLDALDARPGETLVVVTADHGRMANFRDHGQGESGAVWLVAAGGGIPRRGLLSASPPHRLADIAPTLRALLGLEPDARPDAGQPIAELLPAT